MEACPGGTSANAPERIPADSLFSGVQAGDHGLATHAAMEQRQVVRDAWRSAGRQARQLRDAARVRSVTQLHCLSRVVHQDLLSVKAAGCVELSAGGRSMLMTSQIDVSPYMSRL